MELAIYNAQGAPAGTINASDALLGVPANDDLVYQVATSQMANLRQPLAHAKDRSEVRGGGKKPWRQKGTGRARHGSTRSPIWIGGGVAHGPTKDRSYAKIVTRSASRKALACVLSDRRAQGRLLVVDTLALDGKTKSARSALKTLTPHFDSYVDRKDTQSRILVVLGNSEADEQARRSCANLAHVGVVRAADVHTAGVLAYPYVLMTADALSIVEARMKK